MENIRYQLESLRNLMFNHTLYKDIEIQNMSYVYKSEPKKNRGKRKFIFYLRQNEVGAVKITT